MNRFVRPDEITIPLTHGDTITIRRELTHGERTEQYRRACVLRDDRLVRDPLLGPVALITTYLVDWTIQGEGDRKVPIKDLSADELADILNQLQDEAFDEILQAILAHEAALARERSRPEALPPSAAISTSPVAAGGGTNGSAT